MTSLIKNHAAADAIADFLAEGIRHPGDPETKQKEVTLSIPMFSVRGKPPPYDEAAKTANQTIGEAVVYLLESTLDYAIIPNAELTAIREKLTAIREKLETTETKRDELAKKAVDELTQLSQEMGLP